MTIQEKARAALAASTSGDPRWVHLLLALQARTGIEPAECVNRIRELAR